MKESHQKVLGVLLVPNDMCGTLLDSLNRPL